FPAPAGINREIARASRMGERVPRASGDKPCKSLGFGASFVSSPRQRG
ncbi:hypothetical protein HMPREF1606_05230, partial [Escherichia coli 908522]